MMKKLTLFMLGLTFVACSNDAANKPVKAGDSTADAANDPAANKDKENADKALAAARDLSMDRFDYPTIHFAYDSAEIPAESRPQLDQIAKHLQSTDAVTILIAGHCDERGTAEYNLALGENRAKAVRKYLSMMGVAPDRLDTVSFGSAQPSDTSHTEAAYAENRRAVISPKATSQAKR